MTKDLGLARQALVSSSSQKSKSNRSGAQTGNAMARAAGGEGMADEEDLFADSSTEPPGAHAAPSPSSSSTSTATEVGSGAVSVSGSTVTFRSARDWQRRCLHLDRLVLAYEERIRFLEVLHIGFALVSHRFLLSISAKYKYSSLEHNAIPPPPFIDPPICGDDRGRSVATRRAQRKAKRLYRF